MATTCLGSLVSSQTVSSVPTSSCVLSGRHTTGYRYVRREPIAFLYSVDLGYNQRSKLMLKVEILDELGALHLCN